MFTHLHTHTLTLSLSLSHTHTLSLSHTFSHSHTLALCLAAGSSDTQLAWLQAFQGAGLTVLPAANELDYLVKNATSIFDFEMKDIDGEMVSLERYRYSLSFSLPPPPMLICYVTSCRGHVTLIVNVASQ